MLLITFFHKTKPGSYPPPLPGFSSVLRLVFAVLIFHISFFSTLPFTLPLILDLTGGLNHFIDYPVDFIIIKFVGCIDGFFESAAFVTL